MTDITPQRRRVEDLEKDFIVCREQVFKDMSDLRSENSHMREIIEKTLATMNEMQKTMARIDQTVKDMAEIVAAWNNIKGFTNTMTTMSKVMGLIIRILWPVVVVAAAIRVFFKTGHLEWPFDKGDK